MLIIVSKLNLFAIIHGVDDVGVVIVPCVELFGVFHEKDVVFGARLRLMCTRDDVDAVPQTCLRQRLSEFGREAFGVRFHGEEDDCVLLLGMGPILREEIEQRTQKRGLVARRLRFGGVFGPKLQRKGAEPCGGEHRRDFVVLQMTVVNCGVLPSSPQQKGSVLQRTQSEDVNDGEAIGVEGKTAAAPFSEVAQSDAFLRKRGADEGKFVLFVGSGDDVSDAKEGLFGCDEGDFARGPFGEEKGEECGLGGEGAVAECEQFCAFPPHLCAHPLRDLLPKCQQTRKVFGVIFY